MRLQRIVKCGLFLFGLSPLVPPSAVAQSQNAAIAGVVKDAGGAVLPGVTVEASSPALIERARTVVTDRQGAYKIVELRPGSYTVRFTLTGFETVLWEGLELPSSFTATVNADMQVGAVEQTRTVAAGSTLVDTQNVAQHAVTSRQAMDTLPTDRNFTSLASMTPGMQVVGTLQNVGGSDPETRLMLRTHGSRIGESRLFVDGMSVMSGNGTGGVNFGNYLNNAMAQELVVNSDSVSPNSS
jgi:carboxypeptidase family protein